MILVPLIVVKKPVTHQSQEEGMTERLNDEFPGHVSKRPEDIYISGSNFSYI